MQIDYISDLHLEFYIEPEGNQEQFTAKTHAFLQKLLPEKRGDVLVIAGDLSHFNQQSYDILYFFNALYPKIFVVLGNHDYYLVSKKQNRKYHDNSMKRVQELLEMLAPLERVTVLKNFEVVDYNGKTFAGATNWYPLKTEEEKRLFQMRSNDSVYIKVFNIKLTHEQEMYAYEKLSHVDCLITHVPPIILQSHERFGNTACYLNKLGAAKAKLYIFGHCHEQAIYEKGDTMYAINALGYPKEKLARTIRSITL